MKKIGSGGLIFLTIIFLLLMLVVLFAQRTSVQTINSEAKEAFTLAQFAGPVQIFENPTDENLQVDLQFAGSGLRIQNVQNFNSKELASEFLRGRYDISNNSIRNLERDEASVSALEFSKYQFIHTDSKTFQQKNGNTQAGEFFAQKIENLPVFHSWIRVDIHSEAVRGVEGEIINLSNVIKGSMKIEELQKIAQQKIDSNLIWKNQVIVCPNNEKVIYNTKIHKDSGPNENHEAYLIEFCVETNPVYRYVISTSGKVLSEESLVFDQATVTVKDCKGSSSCPTVTKQGSTGDAAKAFEYFDKAQSLFSSLFQERVPNSYVTVNAPNINSRPCPNAGSNGNNIMSYCKGMITVDIFGHEFGHGIIGRNAGLEYKNQSGALNETYADIFGWVVDDDDWTMGEDSTIGVLRSFSEPAKGKRAQPAQVYDSNYYCGTDSNIFVHINSGVLNHAFYLSIAGGEKNGIKVEAVAKDTVQAVYYQALSKYLRPTSNFCDAYKAIIKACEDKTDGNNCEKIKASLDGVQMQFQSPSDKTGMYCSGQKTPPSTPACVLNSGGGSPAPTSASNPSVAPSIVPSVVNASIAPSVNPTIIIPLPSLTIVPATPIKIDIKDPVSNKVVIKQVTFNKSCTSGYQDLEVICEGGATKQISKDTCTDVNTLLNDAIIQCSNTLNLSPTGPAVSAEPIVTAPFVPSKTPITPATKFKIIWQ